MNNNIKLRISGNPHSQGGLMPLIVSGVLNKDIVNEDRTLPISDNPAICICHKADHTLFQLFDKKVLPCDSERDGRLCILMAIPKNKNIQGSISPYTVLMRLYNFFVQNCMEDKDGPIKRFKSLEEIIKYEGQIKAILNEYKLEDGPNEYIAMNADCRGATLCVQKDKLEEFFKDTQYPDFMAFSEIYITTQDNTSGSLTGLSIPRVKDYTILQNDKQIRKCPLNPSDKITDIDLTDTDDKRYDHIEVTLQHMLEAEGHKMSFGKSTVELDIKNRIIKLSVPAQPQYWTLNLSTNEDPSAKKTIMSALKEGKIKIYLGDEDISNKLLIEDSLIASTKVREALRILGTIDGYSITYDLKKNIRNKEAIVIINIIKKALPVPSPQRRGMNNGKINNQPLNGYTNGESTTGYTHVSTSTHKRKLFSSLPERICLAALIVFVLVSVAEFLFITSAQSEIEKLNKKIEEIGTPKEQTGSQEENFTQEDDGTNEEASKSKDQEINNPKETIDSLRNPIRKPQKETEEVTKITTPRFDSEALKKFLDYVNNLDEEYKKHPIWQQLTETEKIHIDNVVDPTRLFGAGRELGKKPNKKQRKYLSELPDNYNFKTIKEISQKNDEIYNALKNPK